MKLLSLLSPNGDGLPKPADSRKLALGWEAWRDALALAQEDGVGAFGRSWSALTPGKHLLTSIFGNSPYLSGIAVKEWAFLSRLVDEGADPLFSEIAASIEKTEDLGEDREALKPRVAFLAAVAELSGTWSLDQQTAALSRFAEAALGAALRHLLREAVRKGLAILPDPGAPEQDSEFIVLGMEKLGGCELNYSSDIDLILLYDPGRVQLTVREGVQAFYVRMARDLV